MSEQLMCCKQIRISTSGTWRPAYSLCKNKATVEVAGKHYCGVHNPIARDARNKARNEQRAEDDKERKRIFRLQAAAPHMLETLEWLESIGGLGLSAHERIRASIAKARGAP